MVTSAPEETTVHSKDGTFLVDAHARAMTAELQAAHIVPTGVTVSMDATTDDGTPIGFYKVTDGAYPGSYYSQATLTNSAGLGHLIVQVLHQPTALSCAHVDARA
jgi:hypothetical protein